MAPRRQFDPDDICTCGEFYGFDDEHRERYGHDFIYDARATFNNWCAEDATW